MTKLAVKSPKKNLLVTLGHERGRNYTEWMTVLKESTLKEGNARVPKRRHKFSSVLIHDRRKVKSEKVRLFNVIVFFFWRGVEG